MNVWVLAMLTAAQIQAALASGDDALVADVHKILCQPYYSFTPRPNQPARFDEQEGFLTSERLISFCVGGSGSGKTTTAAHKAANFVLEQREPWKKDLPFWVIANTYEQVCGVAWFEKLRTIIPPECIDRKRITWHNEKRQWPRSVPLKPWPGKPDCNWVLEFKSYEQGRENMQASAIGGAWFTEQFPWGIFEEVVRGLREKMLPGSVFADFTPIDPEMSVEVENLYERWVADPEKLKDYGFYRMNTEEAVKSGHVTQAWYDAFFGMVSDEMQETRKTGAFASYQGAIYQSFNPAVHYRIITEMPRGVWHKRAIDWGASAEHPFVCLWSFKNGLGQRFFYREYWNDSQKATPMDHIDAIKDYGWPPNSAYYGATYCDPSRPDLINLFSANGIICQPARNDVQLGIECVRRHLKIVEGMQEPLFFVDPVRCPKLARQMRTYRWERSTGMGVNPRVANPRPLKRDDDCVDAARYLCLSDDTAGTVSLPDRVERNAESLNKGVYLDQKRRKRA